MIAAETGAASVADPLGGSWLVERLTDELEAEARDYTARIDALGGMVAAVEAGFPQAEIAEASYATSGPSRRAAAYGGGQRPRRGRRGGSRRSTAPTPPSERPAGARRGAWRDERDAGGTRRRSRRRAACAAATT